MILRPFTPPLAFSSEIRALAPTSLLPANWVSIRPPTLISSLPMLAALPTRTVAAPVATIMEPTRPGARRDGYEDPTSHSVSPLVSTALERRVSGRNWCGCILYTSTPAVTPVDCSWSTPMSTPVESAWRPPSSERMLTS